MICEKCGKEFFKDWRKDKQTIKKTPIPRFCSRKCSNSRIWTKEINKSRSEKLQKREKKLCECGVELSHNNKSGVCVNCKPPAMSKERRKEMIKAGVIKWRQRIKLKAIEYKGGKCIICGYNKCVRSMEFHHLNPNEKKIGIGTGNCVAWERLKKELDKTVLLCSNCHGEVEDGMLLLEDY